MTTQGWAVGAKLPGLAVLAAGAALIPAPLLTDALWAQPMVQAVPVQPAGQALNAALARLARDPRDLSALIDAGNAALVMGDVDAATGFFARADQLSPNNMRVKAGLAGALVRSENPYDAIPLFAEAERAGAVDPLLAADRGLAYDLVGDNANAQKYYRQALASRQSDETVRRLALSQAIGGDRKGMEATLSPLLQRQDKGAWRTRAFALAILGAPEEAVAIANQTMPAELANGIAPYLRFMPRLTPAQQAAAANLGRFPRAAEVGRDDPRVALYAPPRRVAGNVGAGLVPAGEPLGRGRARQPERRQERVAIAPVRAAPPEPAPARSDGQSLETRSAALAAGPAARASVVASLPQRLPPVAPPVSAGANPATTASMHASSAVPAPAQTAVGIGALVRTDVVAPAPTPAMASLQASAPVRAPAPLPAEPARADVAAGSGLVPGGGFDLARAGRAAAVPAPATPAAPRVAASPPAVVAPQPAAPARAPAVPRPRPRSLADAFADLAVVPKAPAAPAPGAVDVRKLAEARARAEAAARVPPKPAHPSRIWVQVGTGRDTSALGFTWRELIKDNPVLFKGLSASISDWGRTNRLLAGPFPTEAGAGSFLAKARKAGVDAFVWTSPAGQAVDALPSR